MFAGMLFRREPFFHGHDNQDQLVKIARVLGTDDLHAYLQKYGIELEAGYRERIGVHPRKKWDIFITAENRHLVSQVSGCVGDAKTIDWLFLCLAR